MKDYVAIESEDMMKKHYCEIKKMVLDFRRAIEVAQANKEPGEFFRKFPVGQCGNTSDMLAQYFLDNGIGPITYVNGTYYGNDFEKMQCHTWLVVYGLVIDITGDQFKYYEEPLKNDVPVYVGEMIKYYQIFEIGPGGKHSHFGLNVQWMNYHELRQWYETILRYM